MKERRLEFGAVGADHREDLYAELLVDDQQWGEISVDPVTKRLWFQIYPSSDGAPLTFDLLELQRLLAAAAKRLCEVEGL